jgi:hypothetical protein
MKALALLSGGLDSTLAVGLILKQGVNVEAANFVTPFCLCRKSGCGALEAAKTFNIPLKVLNAGTDYLKVVRKPKFGYGKNMNPCVDCRIFMLKKAKQYAKAIGAKFLFTGEVLGQRPMSQHKKVFDIIEREARLQGKILRPEHRGCAAGSGPTRTVPRGCGPPLRHARRRRRRDVPGSSARSRSAPSTRENLLREARRRCSETSPRYCAGHPLAGRSAALLRQRRCGHRA